MKKPPECLDRWRGALRTGLRACRTRLWGSGVEIRMEFLGSRICGSGRVRGGGEWREDSEAVNESFWDAPGVEIGVGQD